MSILECAALGLGAGLVGVLPVSPLAWLRLERRRRQALKETDEFWEKLKKAIRDGQA